jgi:hypothetical protein
LCARVFFVVVMGRETSDARRDAMNMLVETADGCDYTGRDFAGWRAEAGFRPCEVLPLAGAASPAIAYK